MPGKMLLYIDPGTGGMLFTVLIGLMGGIIYFFSSLFVKIKYSVGGKNKTKVEKEKIPLVFFSDHKRYFNIFEPVLDELEERGVEVTYLTMSEDDPFFAKTYKHMKGEYIGTGNRAFSRLAFLNAKIVFSTTPGLDVLQWKRSKNVDYYVHIQHACTDATRYRMFGIDYYDAVLLSGEYQIEEVRKLESLRNLPPKELKLVGVPYMDAMLERLHSEEKPRIKADPKEETRTEMKTVLVAPSWGDSGLLKVYGERLLDALLKTGYRIVVRPHPQSYTADIETIRKLTEAYKDSGIIWNRDNDNFNILKEADIMISDFSGVMFDFALVFDKPFLYADFHVETAPYDSAWIEKDLWLYDAIPKIGCRLNENDFPRIREVIDDCIANPKGKENRVRAREETWVHLGEGKKYVADYLVKKLEEMQ